MLHSNEKNKLLLYITTWMNLIDIILSERRQTQKNIYYMIPLRWISSTGKIIYGVYTLFAELSLQSYDWEGTQGKIWVFWKYLNIDLGGDYPRVYVKSYPAIHLRLVHFTAVNLYLNKELKRKNKSML